MHILALWKVSKIDCPVCCEEGCHETETASPYFIFYSFLGG